MCYIERDGERGEREREEEAIGRKRASSAEGEGGENSEERAAQDRDEYAPILYFGGSGGECNFERTGVTGMAARARVSEGGLCGLLASARDGSNFDRT